MQSSETVMRKMHRTQDLCSMAYDTFWKPMFPGSGLRKTSTKQPFSLGKYNLRFRYACWRILLHFSCRSALQHSIPCSCCSSHMAPGFTDYPFPKALMTKLVQHNNGEKHQHQVKAELMQSAVAQLSV